MRKIGNFLCNLAIYCVNFGVNFIFQKFFRVKKMTNMRYAICVYLYSVHCTLYSCDCAVKECHFYVINICSRSALTSYLPTLLHPPPPLHIYSSQPPRTTRNKCNEDTIHSREPNLLNMILFW